MTADCSGLDAVHLDVEGQDALPHMKIGDAGMPFLVFTFERMVGAVAEVLQLRSLIHRTIKQFNSVLSRFPADGCNSDDLNLLCDAANQLLQLLPEERFLDRPGMEPDQVYKKIDYLYLRERLSRYDGHALSYEDIYTDLIPEDSVNDDDGLGENTSQYVEESIEAEETEIATEMDHDEAHMTSVAAEECVMTDFLLPLNRVNGELHVEKTVTTEACERESSCHSTPKDTNYNTVEDLEVAALTSSRVTVAAVTCHVDDSVSARPSVVPRDGDLSSATASANYTEGSVVNNKSSSTRNLFDTKPSKSRNSTGGKRKRSLADDHKPDSTPLSETLNTSENPATKQPNSGDPLPYLVPFSTMFPNPSVMPRPRVDRVSGSGLSSPFWWSAPPDVADTSGKQGFSPYANVPPAPTTSSASVPYADPYRTLPFAPPPPPTSTMTSTCHADNNDKLVELLNASTSDGATDSSARSTPVPFMNSPSVPRNCEGVLLQRLWNPREHPEATRLCTRLLPLKRINTGSYKQNLDPSNQSTLRELLK